MLAAYDCSPLRSVGTSKSPSHGNGGPANTRPLTLPTAARRDSVSLEVEAVAELRRQYGDGGGRLPPVTTEELARECHVPAVILHNDVTRS
jgi:hypothetical protein